MLRTRRNDSVATPAWLYEALDREFHFDHDPCPLDPDPVEDGLVAEWGACNYVNPPYSDIAPWVTRAVREMDERGARSVFLVPVRTTTGFWHAQVFRRASEVRLLDKRVRFADYETAFPHPLAVVVFDPSRPPRPRRRALLANGVHYVSV